MDILSPISPSKCFVSDSKSVRSTPVIYAHGGAHMCVRRSILHHSMTPLARCGLTVYSVEYPLSPEAKYPVAVRGILFSRHTHSYLLHHARTPGTCRASCDFVRKSISLYEREMCGWYDG